MGGGEGEGVILPYAFLQQASGQIFEDDVIYFSSTLDICFIIHHHALDSQQRFRHRQNMDFAHHFSYPKEHWVLYLTVTKQIYCPL